MGLVERIRADTQKAVNATAREVKKKIRENALKSVQTFYESYESDDYERTWGLYTSYKPVDIKSGNDREVGVAFDPSYILTEHKVDNDHIWGWSAEGYHGNPDYPGTYRAGAIREDMNQRFQRTLSSIPGIIQRNFKNYLG